MSSKVVGCVSCEGLRCVDFFIGQGKKQLITKERTVWISKMSILHQAGYSAIVCYSCLTMGLMNAWPSSTIKLFTSANTTLNRPMGEYEVALFGSFTSISAVVTTPFSGYLLDKIGRKNTLILYSLPQVVAWLIVSLSHRVETILAATFISGFGGCLILLTPVVVSELCEDSVRGMMSSGSVISYGLGFLVSYVLGGYLAYDIGNYVCLTMSVLGVVMLCLLKETPLHLMRKDLVEDAMEAIEFYRRVKKGSKEMTREINAIKRTLDPILKDMTPEEERLKPELKDGKKISKWEFLKKSPSTRRALFVALTLYSATMFQGIVAVQVYADLVFAEALPHIPSTLSCIMLAIVTVIASCFTAYVVDIAGRRPLMIYFSFGAGICCLVIGTQIHLRWGSHWITTVFFFMFCITYWFGAGTVPCVFVAEVFLPEIKSLVVTLSVEWAWMCNFMVLFIFTPLLSAIGLGPMFYIFAGICFASAIFCFFFLPETKGLPVDVIQTLLVKRQEKKVRLLKC